MKSIIVLLSAFAVSLTSAEFGLGVCTSRSQSSAQTLLLQGLSLLHQNGLLEKGEKNWAAYETPLATKNVQSDNNNKCSASLDFSIIKVCVTHVGLKLHIITWNILSIAKFNFFWIEFDKVWNYKSASLFERCFQRS